MLQGERRPSRVRPDYARPVEGRPQPPAWLSDEEREAFEDLVDEVDALGVLSATDTGVLTLAAQRTVEVRLLSRVIAREGHTFETTNTAGDISIRPRPEVAQRNVAMRHLHSLLSTLGLSPSDRGRVSGGKREDTSNPYASLRGGGSGGA